MVAIKYITQLTLLAMLCLVGCRDTKSGEPCFPQVKLVEGRGTTLDDAGRRHLERIHASSSIASTYIGGGLVVGGLNLDGCESIEQTRVEIQTTEGATFPVRVDPRSSSTQLFLGFDEVVARRIVEGTYSLIISTAYAQAMTTVTVLKGEPGESGITGPTGPAGSIGAPGEIGSRGPTGIPGEAGPPGPVGMIGPAGARGPQGASGPPGLQGATGPQGDSGPQGIAGPAGLSGPQGIAGPMGETGPAGPDGPAGTQGVPGLVGSTGPAGSQGSTGVAGPTGPAGPRVVLDSTNATTISIAPGSYVYVDGTISITSAYRGIDAANLTVVGGSFVGTGGSAQVYVGPGTRFFGSSFTNLNLQNPTGAALAFDQCSFSGAINFPSGRDSIIVRSRLSNVTAVGSNRYLLRESIVSNSTLPYLSGATNSQFLNNSIIGPTVLSMSNNEFYNSIVRLGDESRLVGNNLVDTVVEITRGGSIIVANNIFQGNTFPMISINYSSNGPNYYVISGNTMDPTLPSLAGPAISIDGNPNTSQTVTHFTRICGNLIGIGNGPVFSYSGSLKTLVCDNIHRRTANLGVTTGGDLTVSNNLGF